MTALHELFEVQVSRTPDAIAAVFEGASLTYLELNQRADDLAQRLRALGVGPDILVALYLERSFDMVVGMLGVVKAGGAYVPLDPIHPPQRLAFMLADARPRVLLTQARLLSSLPPHNSHVVAIDPGAAPAKILPPALASVQTRSPRDLAYVIYTSGSTGNPKGVEIEHHSVVNILQSMQQNPGFSAGDTMLAITTLVFDIAALEIFLPLTVGARIVIAPSAIAKDGLALGKLIADSGVTVLQATPSTLQMLLDTGWTGAPHLKILCGGEAWTEELASRLLSRCKSLWNLYGPTETTIWSAVSKVESGHPIVIGRPIARTSLYVLDGSLQPVSHGNPGELYIGGEGLARGYFNRPELTQGRFVADPFSKEPSARMYRTGDEVIRLQDGKLKFLGRLDQQVKIRGFRIELGEIEANLRNYPGVTEAVVIGRDDPSGEKQLAAYFVANSDISSLALRAHLAATLPGYMVPAAYRQLETLPLTPNGKLDRNALPPPPGPVNDHHTASTAPATPTEQTVANIWCELLNLGQVGVHDNFFDLGGHSLLAVHVIGKINKALQGQLTIPAFYQDPTIAGLAQAIEQNPGVEREAQVLSLQTGQTGLPLYFIGAGAHEVRLARHIGENHAIFAIESAIPTAWHHQHAAADLPAVPTIEKLGGLYGDVLFGHIGASPCVIAGYSFAGKIAFEAAHVLQRAGGNVASVLLIDSPAHVGEGHTGADFMRSTRWIWQTALASMRKGVPYPKAAVTLLGNYLRLLLWLCGQMPTVVKNHVDKVSNLFSSSASLSSYFDHSGVPIEQIVMDQLHYRAGRAWKPLQLDATGILIRVDFPGEETLPGYDFAKGWGKLFARGLRVIQAAGDHMTMVGDKNITALSRQIKAILDQNELVQNLATMRHDAKADVGHPLARRNEASQLPSLS